MSGNQSENLKKSYKRQRLETRRWIPAEEVKVLGYMRELKDKGFEVGQPNASTYYEKLLKKVDINANVDQVKGKVKNLKNSYNSALKWTNESGQGVESGSVSDHVRKICPHWDDLHAIYGDRANFKIPFLFDSLVTKTITNADVTTDTVGDSNANIPVVIAEKLDDDDSDIIIAAKSSVATQSVPTNTIVAGEKSVAGGKSVAGEKGVAGKRSIEEEIKAAKALNAFFSDNGRDSDSEASTSKAIARFKKNLSSPPKSANGFHSSEKPTASNAASVMSVVMGQKADAMSEKNKIEQRRLEEELILKKDELKLNMEVIKDKNRIDLKRAQDDADAKKEEMRLNTAKFEYEKQLHNERVEFKKAKLELKKAELDSNEKIRIMEIQKDERLAILKLKLEAQKTQRTE